MATSLYREEPSVRGIDVSVRTDVSCAPGSASSPIIENLLG